MACAACGAENPAGNRFCISCGATLAVACPACGHANLPVARFCGSCGTPLGETTPAGATPGAHPGQALPTEAEGRAERRLVTVIFSDLVGFTSLAEDRDPEAVREILNRYFDTTTEIVERHGGTVEKFIGDAVMAVWGTPVAHEDDAERAVRAGLEIVDGVRALQPDLEARVGVLSGEAAVSLGATNQGMVAGDLVNTAARLQGVAERGTVLVGEATMRAAERSIVFEAIGEHALKGKATPVPAWRALRVVAQRGGQGRTDALEPPFVGRDEELRQLKEALHATGRERRPRLVSITGPGGIGKSRLAWELLKYIDGIAEDVWWHRGRSPSYGEGITFWALGEMIRRRAQLTEDDDEATTRERIAATLEEHVPDASERERIGPALLTLLGVEDAPEGGRDELFPAWRLFFERIAEKGTTVLVFEDLQWADTGLLDFIDHLLDWSRNLPILVVTLARPELFDRRSDWSVGRRHLTAMALEPLTDAEVREMLDGMVPGLPEDALAAIVGRAEGVPLYAVETVRGLLADGLIERHGEAYAPVGDLSKMRVPDSLRALIASRLDALDADDRRLLQDAAVLGQVFTTDALAAVHGADVAALEPRLRDLVRRELLDVERDPSSPERGQHKFVQSLIREVAYGTLARRERRARHLAVARHYEALGDDELAGALASHYVAAHSASDPGPEADAIAGQARLALAGAAERAASLGGHDQAVSYLEQALAVTTEPSDRAPLLDRAARSAAAASRDAETFATEAIEAYRSLGDRIAAAGAAARLGKVQIEAGEIQRATEVLEAALPEAEATADPAVLAFTLANLARAYMRAAVTDRAIALADRALAIAELHNLEPIVAEALVNKGAALNIAGRRREAAALEEAALAITLRTGDRQLEMRIRNNLASAVSDDDPLRALEMMLETRALAREVGDRGMYNWIAGLAAVTALSAGRDIDEHIAVLRDALDAATLPGDRMRVRVLLNVLELVRGENVEDGRDEILELAGETTDPEKLFTVHMAKGSSAQISGDLETAYREAMAAWDLMPQNPEIPLQLALITAMWARNLDWARLAAERVAAVKGSGELMRAQRLMTAGAVAALEGRRSDAVGAFRESRAVSLRIGMEFDAAALVVCAAQVLPDEQEVRAWAIEARPLLERLRARPWLERLDAALGQPGASAAARTGATVEVPSNP